MKVFDSKDKCTGCGACAAVCPVSCINMELDEEGFLYPVSDNSKCINCGLCRKTCHMKQDLKTEEKTTFFAAYLKEKEQLEQVSSGGVSWAFMETIINDGGVVYGATQKKVGIIEHERATTLKDAEAFKRSKYLQSKTTDVFPLVKKDLNDGTLVLFTGTACQIAALKTFLHKDYDNLYTCDVVCHGVPSIYVFNKYIKEEEEKEKSDVVWLNCRNKSKGWQYNQYELTFANGKIKRELSTKNRFHAGYLSGLFYRPSCGSCKYSCLPRTADLTLADYWKYEGALSNDNSGLGISLVVCSTKHGEKLLKDSKPLLNIEKTSRELAIHSCRHLDNQPIVNPLREQFFETIRRESYQNAYKIFIEKPFSKRIKRKIINIFFRQMMFDQSGDNQSLIKDYYHMIGLNAFFPKNIISAAILFPKRKSVVAISNNKYTRGICKLLRIPFVHFSKSSQKAKLLFAMQEAISYINANGTPVFFINRIGLLKTATFAPSATRRMKKHLDFPMMYAERDKYQNEFKELIGEKYSPEYVEQLGIISQVVKKGTYYRHEDQRSPLVNVIVGQRVTPNQPKNPERILHVYGRCGAFGYAVEDAENIPAQLQKLFNENGYNIKVVNHGLWGAGDENIDSNFLQDAKNFTSKDMVLFYRRHFHKGIISKLEECGLWYKEINKEYYEHPEAKWAMYDKPGHMSRDGYRVVAGLIFDYLKSIDFATRKNISGSTTTDKWDKFVNSLEEGNLRDEIDSYSAKILKEYPLSETDKKCGAIVMNCNPFTKGHRYLAEYAAKRVDRLYIFVVEEDKSFFKFEDRFEMVKEGLNDIKNIVVAPSGKFMISALTFPQYFMKDYVKSKNFDVSGDLELFCKEIAPRFHITKRFAGEEPTDPVTAHYNESMHDILPMFNMEFIEIPRLKTNEGELVNATAVRNYLKEKNLEALKKYVPESTYNILVTKYLER